MISETVRAHASVVICFACGVVAFLFAYRITGIRAGIRVSDDEWQRRQKPVLLGIGAIALIGAFCFFVKERTKPGPLPILWCPVFTFDRGAVAEFPEAVEYQEERTETELGPLVNHIYRCRLQREDMIFSLRYADLFPGDKNRPVDEVLQAIREGLPRQLRESNAALVVVSHKKIRQDGVQGIELEMRLSDEATTVIQIYVKDGRTYAASVLLPTAARDSPIISQFLESFRIMQSHGNE